MYFTTNANDFDIISTQLNRTPQANHKRTSVI